MRPTIPKDDFVPKPAYSSGLWGVSTRTIDGRCFYADAMDPSDIQVNDREAVWFPDGDESGVLWGRVRGQFGISVAVLRAVPLS